MGLDGLVQDLTEQLERSRFVTIAGAGGIGKTTVATLIGKHIQGEGGEVIFSISALFATPSSCRPPWRVHSAWSQSPTSPRTRSSRTYRVATGAADPGQLRARDRCCCEPSRATFAELDEVHILATSRETLRVSGEHVHLLKPLGTPPGGAS